MSRNDIADRVLAECVAKVVVQHIRHVAPGNAQVVLRGFADEVGLRAVERIVAERIVEGADGSPIVVVQPAAPNAEEWLAHGATLGEPVEWRNRPAYPGGRVYVDAGDDVSASFAGLLVVDDLSILSGQTDVVDGASTLLECAWRAVVAPSQSRYFPPELHSVVDRVLRDVTAARVGTPPLAQWTAFVAAVCRELSAGGDVVSDEEVIRSIAERRLPDLGLLADSGLLTRPARRRVGDLEENARLAARMPLSTTAESVDVETLLSRFIPVDGDGEPLGKKAAESVRRRIARFYEGNATDLGAVSFHELRQLFVRPRSTRRHLGDEIRAALNSSGREEVVEAFDALGVRDGLGDGDATSARQFLDLVAGDDVMVVSLIPQALQRRVRSLAGQRGVEPDLLRAVLNGVRSAAVSHDGDRTASLFVTLPRGRGTNSLRALEILFLPTLRGAGAAAIDVHLPERLVEDAHGEEGDDADAAWDRLRVRLEVDGESVSTFEWSPRDQALVPLVRMLLEGGDAPRLKAESLEELIADCESGNALSRYEASVEAASVAEWLTKRKTQFQAWALSGLTFESLAEYGASFEDVQAALLESERPALDERPLALVEFLSVDTAVCSDSKRRILLASHPIRLRWFSAYLRLMSEAIKGALDGSFVLNPVNDALFDHRLKTLSPLGQPEVVFGGSRQPMLSQRELGLNEEYLVVDDGEEPEVAVVDASSVRLLVGIISRYVAEFPHKRDGLSVLLVDGNGDPQLAAALVRALQDRGLYGWGADDARLEVRIAVPGSAVIPVATALEEFDEQGDLAGVLPPLQVYVHDWTTTAADPLLEALRGAVDLVLVPDLFGARPSVEIFQGNAGAQPGDSTFDPLWGHSAHSHGPKSESVVLVPRERDFMLQSWSTLTKWCAAKEALAGSQFEAYRLVASFERFHELFYLLHEVGHWVVTLDRFIGRAQISGLQTPPDVIHVKEGVGKANAFTLTVSSTAGRAFVENRLAARLRAILGLAADESRQAAARLFDLGRNVAPSVMLKALGLGHTTEEVIGLIVARSTLANLQPCCVSGGLEVWLSLDDRPHWFGGGNHTRPDLVRFAFSSVPDVGLHVDVCVVESKYTSGAVPPDAATQARTAAKLFSAVLAPPSAGPPFADSAVWIAELVDALWQLPAPAASTSLSSHVEHEGPNQVDLPHVLESLAAGAWASLSVSAVVAVTAPGRDASHAEVTTDAGDPPVTIFRNGAPVLTTILNKAPVPVTEAI